MVRYPSRSIFFEVPLTFIIPQVTIVSFKGLNSG